jgi:hypothetical protein
MSLSSVERPVSVLRQRMLEDMAMRGLRSDTQRNYISFVREFAAFLGRAPDTATAEDVRRSEFRLDLAGQAKLREFGADLAESSALDRCRRRQATVLALWGHDKIGATAYAKVDRT